MDDRMACDLWRHGTLIIYQHGQRSQSGLWLRVCETWDPVVLVDFNRLFYLYRIPHSVFG